MSGSEPGEMASESLKTVVLSKFDMHIYTSELTLSELTTTIGSMVFLWICIPVSRFQLRYNIKDQDKNVIDMDTFLKLPTWTGTVVSRRILFLRSNVLTAVKETTKRASAEGAEGSKKKRKVQKNNESVLSGFEEALLATPLHQAAPEIEVNQPSPPREHHDAHVSSIHDVHTPQSSYHVNEDELVANRMNSWVAFLMKKVPSRDYQTLGQSVVARGDLLKRHERLNHDYVDLQNHSDADLVELECLRSSLRRANQDNEGMTQKLVLLDNAHFECSSQEKELTYQLVDAEEKIRVLEHENLALSAQVAQADADHKKLVREFIPVIAQFLSETQYLDIEGSKSWEAKHVELFTTTYPYIQKVSNSYDLPMSELLAVCLDVPPPLVIEYTTSSVAIEDDAQQPPSFASKITSDTPFSIII
uniref:Uncharacterized protein n=1 Tax=Tanacetum cinerariifolium TaxID=118510 RepID=A0A6L2MA63_TANCI|nr:hypothetical protein [Tanacetum cinerariifolium]